jgi:hypothetical protein
MPRIQTVLTTLLLFSATAAGAQQYKSIEIVPFGGYRWSGGISNVSGVSKFEAKDAAVFGVALDVNVSTDAALEVYWTRFSGDWETTDVNGEVKTGSFNRDDILLGGNWYAANPGRLGLLYISAGFGVSIYSSDAAETTGRFAWSLGAGIRRNWSERFGYRVGFRWAPTYVTEGSSFWCDSGNCYPWTSGSLFNQWELAAGLIIKIGS